tara:strand:- start:195 stop:1439 length:1245 start_codon:yes stop_codon:yes gene_type:complete
MIRLFLLCLAISIFGLWLTLFLGFPGDPGYLLVAFGSYTFETSLFALLISSVLIYLVFRMLKLIVGWLDLPRLKLLRAKELYEKNREYKAHNATTEAYIQLFLGNWAACYKSLAKGLATEKSVVSYLAASYAAFKGAASEKWSRHLDDAEKKFPAQKPTIELMRAQFLFETGQFNEAKAILDTLDKKSPHDSRLMILLKHYHLKTKEWSALEILLPRLEKNNLIDQKELENLHVRCLTEKIVELSDEILSGDDWISKKALLSLWKKAPKRLTKNEELVRFYVNALIKAGDSSEALKVMEQLISEEWSDQLVLFYGEQDFGKNSHQLVTAEKWLKIKADSSILFLTLARISLRNELTEKAMKYYESSIASSPSAEAYLELSMLLGRVGDEDASFVNLKHYYKFIAADTMNLPLVS